MSYCEIFEFANGVPSRSLELANAHGGAARIWNALFDRYLKDPKIPYDTWLVRNEELWGLASRNDLPLFERAVHLCTFDGAIIENRHFPQFVEHLRKFVVTYPTHIDHLPAWADFVNSSKAEAVAFYHMSVSENPWRLWDEKADDYMPYSLKTGDFHFEIYDELAPADAS